MSYQALSNIISIAYGLVALGAIFLAFRIPKTLPRKALATLLVVLAFGYLPVKGAIEYKARLDRGKETQAIFEEKCRTQAGIKIYRTVQDVEGILLLKIRPKPTDAQLADKMWPGAAFVHESPGEGFIVGFLGYEHIVQSVFQKAPPTRGFITNEPGREGVDRAGYRYIDVFDQADQKRYRYTGATHEVTRTTSPLIGGPRTQYTTKTFVLKKDTAPEPAPRFGVTYEDHVVAADRERWIASSTVRVLELSTNEVLAEMTKYRVSHGGTSPWLRSESCPAFEHQGHDTRKFVDQVLIPRKER